MSKCISCGANLISIPEQITPPGLCQYCRIDILTKRIDQQDKTIGALMDSAGALVDAAKDEGWYYVRGTYEPRTGFEKLEAAIGRGEKT